MRIAFLITMMVMSLSLSACVFPVEQEQRGDRYGNERGNRRDDFERGREQQHESEEREHGQRGDGRF